MRLAIIFAAVLSVAAAASQSEGFLDDELSAVYQLSDVVRDIVWSSYHVLVDGIDQLVSGVPITIQSVIAGGVYSLESLYDGTLNLQEYEINGVEGVALRTDTTLVGKQDLVERVLAATIPAVEDVGKYCKYNIIHMNGWKADNIGNNCGIANYVFIIFSRQHKRYYKNYTEKWQAVFSF